MSPSGQRSALFRRIPMEQTAIIVAFSFVVSLLVNDLVKTSLIRRSGLAPVAST